MRSPAPVSSAFDVGGIDPPDITVIATINDIQLFFSRASEQKNGFVGHVEGHDGRSDGHRPKLLRAFGYDRRCIVFRQFLMILIDGVHDRVGHLDRRVRRFAGMMILQLA